MVENLTTEQVWEAIEKELFAVLGMVTAKQEARTVGIVYMVNNHKLYITSGKTAWKVRHIAQNPHVSLTIPIAKRIFFMPWIKIPAATITFSGRARLLEVDEVPGKLLAKLYRGMEVDPEIRENSCIIEVTPEKDFITYGVGIPLMQMRDPLQARGRVPVNGQP
jgi:uncharacterized pyridoxamine 5'-phosphate oxidase family protein